MLFPLLRYNILKFYFTKLAQIDKISKWISLCFAQQNECCNPNKLLPANLCICHIDSCLYRIGLQVSAIRPNTKRSFIYNPILISIYVSLYVIQRIVCLFVTDQDLLYILGDTGAFYGIRTYSNMLLALVQLFVLSNKWFYYCNHKRGIHPTFLRLFQMMSGSLRPIDLDLDDPKQVMTLLNLTKKLNPLLKFNCRYVVIPVCVAVVLPSYVRIGLEMGRILKFDCSSLRTNC